MSGQSPFACIPSYPRAFAFPLPVAPASPAPPQRHMMLPRGQLFWPSAPASQASHTPRARAARPRAPAIRPSKGAPTPGPTAPFKPFRTDPLNREPAPKPAAPARFKPFRTDPLNREPTAKPTAPAQFKPSRIDPLNREPTAKPAPTAPFKPSRTDPLNREPAVPPNPTYITPTRAAAVPHAPRRIRPPHQPPPAPPPPDHHTSAARRNPHAQRSVLAHRHGGSQWQQPTRAPTRDANRPPALVHFVARKPLRVRPVAAPVRPPRDRPTRPGPAPRSPRWSFRPTHPDQPTHPRPPNHPASNPDRPRAALTHWGMRFGHGRTMLTARRANEDRCAPTERGRMHGRRNRVRSGIDPWDVHGEAGLGTGAKRQR
jgi:hypothetical protein